MKNFLLLPRKSAFTLVEIIIVVVIFSTMIISVIQLFISMSKTKVEVEAKETLLKWSYYTMETLANVMQNYTIDYEQYFNRKLSWCNSWLWQADAFTWWSDINQPNCQIFDGYWNKNSLNSLNNDHYWLYYCSTTAWWWIIKNTSNILNWCYQTTAWAQSFWQYQISYLDVKSDADWASADPASNVLFDDDDLKQWLWPIAIGDNTNIKELYLISKDKKHRTFIRRSLVSSWDFDRNWIVDKNIDKLYTLQILRLRGYDAWNNHQWDGSSAEWYQDWIIDTWVCDSEKWFVCHWNQVMINWKPYNLPADQNDWWANMLDWSISLNNLTFQIYPVKDPKVAWWEENIQVNPYFSVNFSSNLYGQNWSDKYNPARLINLTQDLQTTFNTKSY